MTHVVWIGLDNSVRLNGRIHYFEFGGFRFKLIQNDPHRYSDVMATLVESYDEPSAQAVFAAAGEFASALNWRLDFSIAVRPLGAHGVGNRIKSLRRVRCGVFGWPEIPFQGNHYGYDLSRIARTTTVEQRRALALYREAQSANKDFLSLLLNWQVLDVRGGESPQGWVDRIWGDGSSLPNRIGDLPELVARLNLGGRSLGAYLNIDCRHAVAHLRRERGGAVLRFDDRADWEKMNNSNRVVRRLAHYFIETELGVTDWLYLVRPRGGGFPRYVSEDDIEAGRYEAVRGPDPKGFMPKMRYVNPGRPRRAGGARR